LLKQFSSCDLSKASNRKVTPNFERQLQLNSLIVNITNHIKSDNHLVQITALVSDWKLMTITKSVASIEPNLDDVPNFVSCLMVNKCQTFSFLNLVCQTSLALQLRIIRRNLFG